METLTKTKEGSMDQNCSRGLSLGLGLSTGTGATTSDKDHGNVSNRNVNGPPVELDLFPLAPLLPPHRSGCGTLSWEKTLRGISIFLP